MAVDRILCLIIFRFVFLIEILWIRKIYKTGLIYKSYMDRDFIGHICRDKTHRLRNLKALILQVEKDRQKVLALLSKHNVSALSEGELKELSGSICWIKRGLKEIQSLGNKDIETSLSGPSKSSKSWWRSYSTDFQNQ